jgi:hypothetical protein
MMCTFVGGGVSQQGGAGQFEAAAVQNDFSMLLKEMPPSRAYSLLCSAR